MRFNIETLAHPHHNLTQDNVARKRSLLAAVKQCSHLKDLRKGREIHSQVIENELLCDTFLSRSLIYMYGKCGSMPDARSIFDKMDSRDLLSWNALLQGYVDNGENEEALRIFNTMQEYSTPNSHTYVSALKACTALAAKQRGMKKNTWLEHGKSIHSQAVANNACDKFVEGKAIDMFAKSGQMCEARKVFDNMAIKDVVSWTSLLQGYVENGQSELALELFEDGIRRYSYIVPNDRTYVVALTAVTACANFAKQDRKLKKYCSWLEKGKALHLRAKKSRCSSLFLENTLIDMYAKCGSMEFSKRIFDRMERRDIVSWNALLQGYVENEQSELAIELFDEMESVCTPDSRTYVVAISACASLGSAWLGRGRSIHARLLRCARTCDIFVESTLIDMYAKCGSMLHAVCVFYSMLECNEVTWNCLLWGYVENADNQMALEFYNEASDSGYEFSSALLIAAITACGNIPAIEKGKVLHEKCMKYGLDKTVTVGTCLVEFYGKCGIMETAKRVFDGILGKNIVTWNSLMGGYSLQGDTQKVIEVFEDMREQGIQPDEVAFVCILSACSHAGLTDKGKGYFDEMYVKYGIAPTVRHYSCMVDLLGRANYLNEALKTVRNMPFEPGPVVWNTLLGACKKWNNVTIGKVAYDELLKLDKGNPAPYVFMTNIYKGSCLSEVSVKQK